MSSVARSQHAGRASRAASCHVARASLLRWVHYVILVHYIILYDIISYYMILYYSMLHYIISYYIILYCIISYHIIA